MLALLPEIILIATALIVIIYDLIKIIPARKSLLSISLTGLFASFIALLLTRPDAPILFFNGLYMVDPLSTFFKGLFIFIGIIVILINYIFFYSIIRHSVGEFYALFLISLSGLMLMASSQNLIIIYLGMEMVGFTSYLLSGWQKSELRSGEAAIKYFIYGASASAVFLYGISIIYGQTGTLDLSAMHITLSPVMFIAVLLAFSGFAFKISSFPFQFWAPDVYEGSPTPITAYLSTGAKAAGFAALIRFLLIFNVELSFLIAVLAVVTMTWGNMVAIQQKNIKRMLAYSSIAQAGFILIGMTSGTIGYSAAIFYILIYCIANLGLFAVVINVSKDPKSEEIDCYSGLAIRSPYFAACGAIFLLSLIGIPPLAGFMAKFLVLKSAFSSGYLWLVVAGLINSLIAAYYYLNIIRQMYFQEGDKTPTKTPFLIGVAVTVCLVIIVLLSVFPHWFLNIA